MNKDLNNSLKPLPIVSLLIAMRNEEQFISGCLSSIFYQNYPARKIEVFILDGMSSDSSWKIAEQLIQGKDDYHLLLNQNLSQSAAWNIGIEKAKGDLITIVSAHSVLAHDYVSNAVETYLRTGADLVGGPVKAFGENKVAKAVSIATSNPFGIGGARFHYTEKEEIVDTVFMGFCSRKLYEEIGGFDEEMVRNQDDEFSYRILDYGGKIVCNPAIKSKYYNRSTISSLWRQYFQYGCYKIRVLQKHPRQMRLRQFVPATFTFTLLVSLLLMTLFPSSWVVFALVAGSYILANLTASILAGSKKGWQHLTLLPLIFAVLHLSYGFGFLSGLIKFWNRWGDKKGKVPKVQFNKV
jgi:succinoglycan biosynthesis protein ExoA